MKVDNGQPRRRPRRVRIGEASAVSLRVLTVLPPTAFVAEWLRYETANTIAREAYHAERGLPVNPGSFLGKGRTQATIPWLNPPLEGRKTA